MYELRYVKKRKRNKWIAVGAGVSTIVITSFAIVAFLGRYVGTFTVSLNTGNVELALSDSLDFENPVSFMRVNSLPSYHENTYRHLPEDAVLDSEETDYLNGATYKADGTTVDSINYFKYTFFVKNVGQIDAGYTMKLNIVENTTTKDGRGIDDTLRVMIYENDGNKVTNHEKKIYAKKSATHHIAEDGSANFQEPITVSEYDSNSEEPFLGYAEMFESESVISTITVSGFAPGDIRRYTLVTWLEGYDLQSNQFQLAPQGATLKLGVEINAYENQ